MRSLGSFERELKDCSDWRDAFKIAIDGLVNNVFSRSLREIDETNLPTLELRNPGAYATIEDRETREALVISGLFQVDLHKSSRAEEDLEVCWDARIDSQRILYAIDRLAASRDSALPVGGDDGQLYAGVEAVKVFLRALDKVVEEIEKSDWERLSTLHRIAFGTERKYPTLIDEIRICSTGLRLFLAKAMRRLSGSERR